MKKSISLTLTLVFLLLLACLSMPACSKSADQNEAPATEQAEQKEQTEQTEQTEENKQFSVKDSSPFEWIKAVKDTPQHKLLVFRSLLSALLCGVFIYLLWNESEKRNKRKEMLMTLAYPLVAFLGFGLGLQIFIAFLPIATYIMILYPMLYWEKTSSGVPFYYKISMVLIVLCLITNAPMIFGCPMISGYRFMGPFAYFLGVASFIVAAGGIWKYRKIMKAHIEQLCPLCYGYGEHEFVSQHLDHEEISMVDSEYDTFDRTEYKMSENKRIDHYIRHRRHQVYIYQYYTDTYRCICCNKEFTKKNIVPVLVSDQTT